MDDKLAPAATGHGDAAALTGSGTPSGYRLGRDSRYLTWLASDTAVGLSSALAGFAIPLIVLEVTGSPVQAGVLGGISMLVRLIATLVGGVLADRHNRFALMVAGALIGLILAAAFALLSAADAMGFAALLVLSVLLSARGGVFEMAGESAIKEVVPTEAMGRAQAANQARDAAMGLVGGPLGGVLLAVGGWLVGAVMAVCQALALISSLVLRREYPRVERGERRKASSSALREAREGIIWLIRRPDLRGALIVATVVNLGLNSGMTAVIYSLQMGGTSPKSIGALTAITSAAMLAGAAVSPALVTRFKAGTLVLVGLVLCAAGVVAVSRVESIGAIAAVMSGAVVLAPALNASLLGYMIVATPSELLGRVNSAARVMAMGAMPLAPLVAGFGLAWIGREVTLLAAGAICVIAVVMTLATPSLRAIPRESEWSAHAELFADAA